MLLFYKAPDISLSTISCWISASERICIAISLMFSFAINTFETMWTWLTFLCFKSWWVNLEIWFTIPCKVPMIFYLVWTVTLDTFETIHITYKHYITPLLVVFILQYFWVYICASDFCDVTSNIKAPIY